MKRIVLMAVLALALPVAAFANGVDFGNTGGTLSGSSAGLTLTGSNLSDVCGMFGPGCIQGGLGSLTFTTGALMSGNLTTGATFSGVGSSFVITGNGTNGVPNGVIFNGTFVGTITWVETTNCGPSGAVCYTLLGAISGTYSSNGGATSQTVNGATVQLTFTTSSLGFMGQIALGSGNTVITTVPEPGTLGLLGTGLVGLAGIVRKKLKA